MVIQGNLIGTDISGRFDLGNESNGITIGIGGSDNTIGGATLTARNIISANLGCGIRLTNNGTTGNVVQGNLIGTDVTGIAPLGNHSVGIYIDGAPDNLIGGYQPGDGNVISGNANSGVIIAYYGTAQNNVIQGNLIGVAGNGTTSLANAGNGVSSDAPFTTIGGDQPGTGNIIANNAGWGVYISGSNSLVQGNIVCGNAYGGVGISSANNQILGNSVGITATGMPSGNNGGVFVYGSDNFIEGNVISRNSKNRLSIDGTGASGNVVQGNFIGTDITGKVPLGNQGNGVEIGNAASDNTIGGFSSVGPDGTLTGAGNVISANTANGVLIDGGASFNFVQGNFIGTGANGTEPAVAIPAIASVPSPVPVLGNGQDGILIQDSPNNVVGQQQIEVDVVALGSPRNIVSGNLGDGISIAGSDSTGNWVQDNYVGTDVTGMNAIPNGNPHPGTGEQLGIRVGLGGANNNTITGNLVSGNLKGGVSLDNDAFFNTVVGNWIGTDSTYEAALPNGDKGLIIQSGASDNTVQGNTIPSNHGIGVVVGVTGTEADNTIADNFIGTDPTGTLALPNWGDGLYIVSSDNQVTDNVISANTGNGVTISAVTINGIVIGATGNVLQGNQIGTDPSGTLSLGNWNNGVFINFGASSNVIQNNAITFNVTAGVGVGNDATDLCTGNAILNNSIHDNGALGIDLGNDGVTPNGSGPVGPNDFQNYPVLTSVVTDGSSTIITGTLNAAPNSVFIVQFFDNPTGDSSGNGQGQNLLAVQVGAEITTAPTVTTDSNGTASFTFTIPGALGVGDAVTATATDPSGNTSEFSAWVMVNMPTVTVTGGPFTYDDQSQGATITVAGAVPGDPTPSGTTLVTYSSSTYGPSTIPPIDAGTYAVNLTFFSNDPNYTNASGIGSITINPAMPMVSVSGGPFTYDGTAHAVITTITGAGDAVVSGSSTVLYTYPDGSKSGTPPTNAGTYPVSVTFTSTDADYTNASGIGSLIINPVTTQITLIHQRDSGRQRPTPDLHGHGCVHHSDSWSAGGYGDLLRYFQQPDSDPWDRNS